MSTFTPDQSDAIDRANGKAEQAAEAAELARAKVDELREKARNGDTSVTAKDLTDARAASELADLAAEAAQREAARVYQDTVAAATETWRQRYSAADATAKVQEAREAVQVALEGLAAVVVTQNDEARRCHAALSSLGAPEASSVVARARTVDLGLNVARAFAPELLKTIRANSGNAEAMVAAIGRQRGL